MVNIRRARTEDREEIPLHYEVVSLRSHLSVVAWIAALTLTVGGVVTMVRGDGSVVELLGALAAAAGGISGTALVRCSRHEVTVGKKWLRTALGPIKKDLPMALIVGATTRPSTGWRRLYADDEIVFELTVGTTGSAVPTKEPQDLLEALAHLIHQDRSPQA